jgi:hypothetical protein
MAPWPALEASRACAQVSAAASKQAIQNGTIRQLRRPREPPALPVRLHVVELRTRLDLSSLPQTAMLQVYDVTAAKRDCGGRKGCGAGCGCGGVWGCVGV